MKIDISTWSTTPFQRIHELPAAPGLYIVFEQQNCLYVGRSVNLKGRWRTHPRSMDLVLKGANEVRWCLYPESALESLEMVLIQQYAPAFNVRVKPEKGIVPRSPSFRAAMLQKFEGSGYLGMAPTWKCSKCSHMWLVSPIYNNGSEPTHCSNFKCRSRLWNK